MLRRENADLVAAVQKNEIDGNILIPLVRQPNIFNVHRQEAIRCENPLTVEESKKIKASALVAARNKETFEAMRKIAESLGIKDFRLE